MSPSTAIACALLLPLVGAVLVAVCRHRPNLRETITLVTGVVASFQADIPTGPLLVCMFGLAMFVGLLIRFVVRARPGSVMHP